MKNMKKVAAALSVVAIAAITLVSCSKKGDYTCVCSVNGQEIGRVTFNNVKKSDAEKSCNASATAGGVTETCAIQ